MQKFFFSVRGDVWCETLNAASKTATSITPAAILGAKTAKCNRMLADTLPTAAAIPVCIEISLTIMRRRITEVTAEVFELAKH